MIIMIIIPYTLTMYISSVSSLSISPCTALVFRVIAYLRILYTIALSTRAMLNVAEKCVAFGEALQSFVCRQHDGVGKIKYRKELRSCYATFVYYNHNCVVCECDMSRRRDRKPSRTPVKKMKRLSQKSRKLRVFVWKRILKVTPLSSKLRGYIGWRLKSQIKRRPTIIKGLRFVKKKKEKKEQAPIRVPANFLNL